MTREQFCDTEFQDRESPGLDRALSVYRIERDQHVQCYSEHYAGNHLDPKNGVGFDLGGLAEAPLPAPLHDDWPFGLTRGAHCEIRSSSDQEVEALAARLHAALKERTCDIAKLQIRDYVRRALAAGDWEWQAYLNASDVKPTWRRLAGAV